MQRCFDTLARSGAWMERVKDPDPAGGDIVVCRCCRSSGPRWDDVPHARWCGIPAALQGLEAERAAPAAPNPNVVELFGGGRARTPSAPVSPPRAGATVVALPSAIPLFASKGFGSRQVAPESWAGQQETRF